VERGLQGVGIVETGKVVERRNAGRRCHRVSASKHWPQMRWRPSLR
jgi:hypothetical protein